MHDKWHSPTLTPASITISVTVCVASDGLRTRHHLHQFLISQSVRNTNSSLVYFHLQLFFSFSFAAVTRDWNRELRQLLLFLSAVTAIFDSLPFIYHAFLDRWTHAPPWPGSSSPSTTSWLWRGQYLPSSLRVTTTHFYTLYYFTLLYTSSWLFYPKDTSSASSPTNILLISDCRPTRLHKWPSVNLVYTFLITLVCRSKLTSTTFFLQKRL